MLELKCSTSTCSSIQTDVDSLETSVSALSENGGGDQNDDDDQKEMDGQEHHSQLPEKMMMMIKIIMIPDSCMQSPTDSSCTGEDIGGTDSLPDKVNISCWKIGIYCQAEIGM